MGNRHQLLAEDAAYYLSYTEAGIEGVFLVSRLSGLFLLVEFDQKDYF